MYATEILLRTRQLNIEQIMYISNVRHNNKTTNKIQFPRIF